MSGERRTAPPGAHYGIRDWLLQRVTAVLLLLFLLLVLGRLGISSGSGYGAWAGVFAPLPVKLLAVAAFAAVALHAWIGMRDIWMDYVRILPLRLALHVLTVLWLVACLAWSVRILWSV